MSSKRVLIIEDDPNLIDLLEIHLNDLECELDRAMDGETGLRKALGGRFDLIVLDVMLPQMDGLEICRRLRAKEIRTPILMLTARSEEIDKVLGLEMGADDYLTKPFSVREFIARVKAIFRRMELWQKPPDHAAPPAALKFGNLSIDIDKRKVTINDKRVELSPKEFDLLSLLASNPGKSYDRSRLLDLVWGYEFEGYEHTVNSHINRLRGKIEPDIAKPTYILTTWGVGYRFNEEL
ncbi:MAG TPA: response regulator transcription factor [Bacteroidetes bacterium]|nr:response regulator transcription factor [Bacteroidota bacterium]